jgi:HSP20 family protein
MSFLFYDPFQEMQRMQREMDRIFGRNTWGNTSGALTSGGGVGDENRQLAVGGSSSSGGKGGQLSTTFANVDWHPRCDLSENEKSIVVEAELPGVDKQDVKLEVDDDVLTLRGETRQEKRTDDQRFHKIERSRGTFLRSFRLPEYADLEGIQANFQDGVLKVEIPKREMPESEKHVRSIDIK